MSKTFKDMTNKQLANVLMAYGKNRAGEIQELTMEASTRIVVLEAKVNKLMEFAGLTELNEDE